MQTTTLNNDNVLPNFFLTYLCPKIKKYRFEAHCVSEICCKNTNIRNSKTGSIKNLSRFKTDCPDCGHVVVWNRFEMGEI